MGNNSAQSRQPATLSSRWRRATSTLFAFLFMFGLGSAWADSLVVMSGAGQSGLGGSAGARPIVVQARNVDGVVIAGRTINWTASNGFVLSAASSVTDVNGLASVSFTYGNYGTTAIVAADPVGATSATAMETSTGSDSITLISGGGQAGQAGSAAAQPIVVQVLNAAGNPVSGRPVNWADTTAYTQVNAASSSTNASGQASMGFRFLSGVAVLGGAAAGIKATNSTGGQSVTANVTDLGVNFLQITSSRQVSGVVGGTSPPIVARVTDWAGNPIAGAIVTWSTPTAGRFNLSSTSTPTDASGNASITAQYLAAGIGGDIITASYNGVSEDVHFFLQTATSMNVVSPNPVIGSPNTASTTSLAIQDFNKDGSPRVGDTITWTVQSGDATLNAPTSVTDASGTATMGFTFGTLFTQFGAVDTRGVGRGLTANPSVTGQSVVNVSGAGQAGRSLSPAASPMVMKVVDQAGTPVSGVTINWSQYANGTFGFQGNVVFTSATSSVSDINGLVQVTFNYGAIGKVAIRGNLPVGVGTAATVTSYGTDTLSVVSGANQSGLVGTHGTQPIVVLYRDSLGNPVSGLTINWTVQGGNAVLDAATSVTNASGQASIGFTYGMTASITDIEAVSPTSGGVNAHALVTGVGANSLSLISGNGQTGLPSTAGAQPMVVEVRDAAGNPVPGRSIFWSTSVPPGAPVANASSSVTDASGRASMGFTYGTNTGSSALVANDAVTLQQVTFTVTALKVQNQAVIISGNGQTGLPGTAGPQPIVIELRDASNAPLPGKTVNWSVVSGPATLGPVTTITDASGQAAASFNFGATAGTSIIQAQGPDSGQLLQAAVTALGNNQALSVVSGDAQTLVANTTSEPLVVLLKNFANAPVVGATINWTTTSGTLASATSVTDANGRASNTVTTTVAGAVTVHANSPLASSPISFTLNTGLATLPNLTPEQEGVAVALDNACPALAGLGTLSPEQADLLARCQDISAAAGINGGATAAALGELLADTAQAQSSTAAVAVTAQVQNVNARLMALRSGVAPVGVNGLTFTGPGGTIQLGSLMSALAGDEVKPTGEAGAGFSRWGFFATGNIGRGEADATRSSPAYDYDINGITVGIDYRQRDNLVMGAALGYTRQGTDLSNRQGKVSMSGWSLSGYSTYSFKELWYVDGVVTVGRNQFELVRRIDYTLPTPGGGSTSIHQVATGKPDGDLFSTALTFGGDFHKDAWGFSPFGQLVYSRTGFAAYSESLRSGPGSGLGLAVESREITALTGILGARVTMTHSADWGVFVPTASLEWNHEFKDDPDAIAARLIYDPTQTLISISGEPMDSDYLRVGVGMSLVLTRGRSGFFLFQHLVARDGQSQDNLSLGIRVEF